MKTVQTSAQSAGKGAEKASIGIGKFGSSILRIAKYRIVRSVIRNIFSAFSEGLTNVREFSDGLTGEGHRIASAMDAMSSKSGIMKNQIGSAFAELLTQLMPIIEQIVSLLTRAANIISQFFAALGGNSKYYKAVDATAQVAKNLGGGAKSAKEIRNQLMGFDVINRLDSPDNGGGGGGGGTAKSGNNMFEYTDISSKIKDNLAAIEMMAAGFLLAIGMILLFTGANVPLGLGMIAAGAYMLSKSISADWNTVSPKVQTALAAVMAVVSVAFMAIGAVFLLTGNVGVGLGLMLAGGAAAFGVSAIFGKLNPEVQSQLKSLMVIAGTALAAMGVVFLLLGHFGIGIGMILAGGALGISAKGVDWGALLAKLQDVWKGIVDWFTTGVKKYFTMEYWDELFGDSIIASVQSFADTLGRFLDPVINLLDKVFAPRSADLKVDMWMNQWVNPMGIPGLTYASGGFPTEGQIFFAREAGPELVGQIGNRTAVANNQDIVQGIENGVYRAMSSALAGQQNNNRDVRVYLDGKEIGAASRRYERNMNRATGVAMG